MKILFSMRHPGALRNFASTLRALADRGHRVHLVFAKHDKEGDDRLLRELTASYPTITAGTIERKIPWRFWLGLARGARYTVDYVRYLTPEYAAITSLTERARVKAARRLGVRSAVPVLSWDNLTNKGLIRVPPDQVLVWNEAQKTEAVMMH